MKRGERHLPTGTVTLLFTDIEGSTRMLQDLGRETYVRALTEHRRLLREAFTSHGGVEVEMQGDSFHFAFPYARDAVAAAAAGQRALAEHAWESQPIKVRIGLHTGEPMQADGLYAGLDVHRAARVMSAAHGGQVLLSARTADLVSGELPDDISLVELGQHRLKDLSTPQTLYQVGTHDFPPLKTLHGSNLPRPATSFIGRERELARVGELLADDGVRLMTLTGPGGTGKTRLAIHAATQASPSFPDGVHWVGLAALRDATLVMETISQALAARDGLVEHIGERRLLILIDNLEQVIEAAPQVAALLPSCPNLTLLVTSRETLRVQAEVEYAVPPLDETEAVALFCARAGMDATPEIAELCARLDALPLAVELAAARTKVLSPAQILERLSHRLDLLRGGRDADPRQQTLRATIEWSYDLLSEDEQRLFACLSVFAGGCTLEAAEEVAQAELDALQSLVEKSLLRFSAGRYWMLETISEFAGERLAESGRLEESKTRHADFVLKLAAQLDATSGSEAERTKFHPEQDNFRRAVAWAEQTGDTELQLELVGRTWAFWAYRGPLAEGLRWARSALARSEGERSAPRAKALAAGAMFAFRLGELDLMRRYADESLAIARSLGDPGSTAWPLVLVGISATELGDYDAALGHFEQAIAAAREAGDMAVMGIAINNLGDVAMRRGDFVGAVPLFEEALAIHRELQKADDVALETYNLAFALHHTGRPDEAVTAAKESLTLAHEIENLVSLGDSLVLLGALACRRGNPHFAARLLGVAEVLRDGVGEDVVGVEAELRDTTVKELVNAFGEEEYANALAEGRAMSLEDAVTDALRFGY